jgi:hypothetical protein
VPLSINLINSNWFQRIHVVVSSKQLRGLVPSTLLAWTSVVRTQSHVVSIFYEFTRSLDVLWVVLNLGLLVHVVVALD